MYDQAKVGSGFLAVDVNLTPTISESDAPADRPTRPLRANENDIFNGAFMPLDKLRPADGLCRSRWGNWRPGGPQ